ncbi:hypothetical protein GCM10009828_097030 [Actinoplanes couchii]|uniref:Uncharacterized protein n=1 Tax=Actinoplanes couchii TaxID=403638 RepID=A0ABQ3XHI0_9ACTN|nr:hypothetical protein Aco03nite_063550 [Actinoplanes couchii]
MIRFGHAEGAVPEAAAVGPDEDRSGFLPGFFPGSCARLCARLSLGLEDTDRDRSVRTGHLKIGMHNPHLA